MHGEDSQWDLIAQLLAGVSDDVRTLVWFQTKDGAKGRNRPKRIPRPGIEQDKTSTVLGSDAVTIAEFEEWLRGDFVEIPQTPET